MTDVRIPTLASMPPAARAAALLGALAALGAPSTAAAAEFVVDPSMSASASCASQKCPTIQKAIDAAGSSSGADVVRVLKGTYAESPTIGAGNDGLTLVGTGAGEVKVTGSGSGDVFTVDGADATLSAMTIDTPADAGSAVLVTGAGARLENLVAQRTAPSGADDPVIDVAGGARISGGYFVQAAGTGPVVLSRGTGGVALVDSVAISSVGHGVTITDSADNSIVRSTVVSAAPGAADAVRLAAADTTSAKKLVLESSYLLPSAADNTDSAGLRVVTTGDDAGDVVVVGRHLTIAKGQRGIVISSAAAQGPGAVPLIREANPAGNITATFVGTIAHGASATRPVNEATAHPGGGVAPTNTAANSAALTFSHSDAPAGTASGGAKVEMGGAQNTDDALLFAPNAVKLRADSEALDRGGPLGDESGTDVDREPRLNGAATDIGADEFHNKAPSALFGATATAIKESQAVGFISGSTDPEQNAGGGIVEYQWTFGDGRTETTTVGGVAHTYEKIGTYDVTLRVKDRQGALSEPSKVQTISVADGTAPVLSLAVPTDGQTIRLHRKKGKVLPLTIFGSWTDPSGIAQVEVALRVVKRDKVAKKKKKKRARRSAAATCEFYSGRLLARKRCDRPIWIKAVTTANGFALQTRKGLKLPKGRYELRLRATDTAGNRTTGFAVRDKTLAAFRVR